MNDKEPNKYEVKNLYPTIIHLHLPICASVTLGQGNVAVRIGHLADASQCIRQEVAGLGFGYLSFSINPVQKRIHAALQYLSQTRAGVRNFEGKIYILNDGSLCVV